MRIRKKLVNGQEYHYLEESIRLEKARVYSIFLGRKIPGKSRLEKLKQELQDRIYDELLNGAARIYLTREQLIEAEKCRRQYALRMKKLGKSQLDEKDEIDIVNFVYTTLTTEGVPVTKEDAALAYKFTQKNAKSIRDENLRVALDMIKGLRYVKDSKKGISLGFLLELHKIIMAGYGKKNPGKFRRKQAYIYLKSYEKVEEIGFRPTTPKEVGKKLAGLVGWYNANVGKLNAVELAALLHLRFYKIHPFEDGNKRVSRLLLNKAFFDAGYPMLNISKETQGYFDALIKSVERADELPFVEFVFERFVRRA
ncbi:MAG: Fic family protein [Candidatus Micrarchaeia archaeon]|jgi:Fic family protein